MVTQQGVLYTGRLGFLLETAFFSLERGHELNVVTHDLVVEDLLLLKLGLDTFDFLGDLEEALSLVLFIS